MAFVITDKCLGERYAQCMEVCPVDCIYPGDKDGQEFMVIDPDICIDCNACVPVCPIDAIVGVESEAPEYAVINAELAPQFKGNPEPVHRPKDDPPHRSSNTLVN